MIDVSGLSLLEQRRIRSRVSSPTTLWVKPLKFRNNVATFYDDTSHEIMLSGAAETGKTFASLCKLHYLLASTPNAIAILVKQHYSSIKISVLPTFEKIINLSSVKPALRGGQRPTHYDYPNGAALYLVGMDDGSGSKILSSGIDYAYINQAEQLALQDWEYILTRCTGRAGNTTRPQVFGDCNPSHDKHWILQRRNFSLTFYETSHMDNPTLFSDEGNMTEQGTRTIAILNGLTGVRRDRLYLNKWVSVEGLVYEDYSPSRHNLATSNILWGAQANWLFARSIDFGYRNPFVCLWFAINRESSEVYLIGQYYMTQRTINEHIKHIERISDELATRIGFRPTYEVTIADHDSDNIALLQASSIPITKANKRDIPAGIEAVTELFRTDKLFICSDSVFEIDIRLLENKQPLRIEDELMCYAWKESTDAKDIPDKRYDHAMDALRYFAVWLKSRFGSLSGNTAHIKGRISVPVIGRVPMSRATMHTIDIQNTLPPRLGLDRR